MTQTNQTPFVKAVEAFLNLKSQENGKYAEVFKAMVDMPTTFPSDWTHNFLVTSGPEKTELLESTFRKLEFPGYTDLLAKAQAKLEKPVKDEDAAAKQDAFNKVQALHTMLKTVVKPLAYYHLKNATAVRLLKGRVQFRIEDTWEGGKTGYTFNDCITLGTKAAKEAGWVSEAQAKVNTSKPSTGAASEGGSLTEDVAKGGRQALRSMCISLRAMLETVKPEQLSESEQQAMVELETAMLQFQYPGEGGHVDAQTLYETYAMAKAVKAA